MRIASFWFVVSWCLVSLSLFATAKRVEGAGIDLASSFTDGTVSAEPGEDASYSVTYSNLSGDTPVASYLNVHLPLTAFVDDPAFTVDIQDSLGNVGNLFMAASCEGLLIQLQGSGDDADRPIPLELPPNTTGTMTFALKMPMQPVIRRTLGVQLPPEPPQVLDFGVGPCDDCDDLSTCFGPRITTIVPAVEAKLTIVDDGSGSTGSLGCVSIKNHVAGTIALVRRGDCEFGIKAMNAQIAGALACIIMNNDPNQDVTSFTMAGGEFGALVNIPVAILNNADADPIEATIEAGNTLIAWIGGVETEELEYTSEIFHSIPIDTDPDPSNDIDTFVTTMPLFFDGFESGETTAWSNSVP